MAADYLHSGISLCANRAVFILSVCCFVRKCSLIPDDPSCSPLSDDGVFVCHGIHLPTLLLHGAAVGTSAAPKLGSFQTGSTTFPAEMRPNSWHFPFTSHEPWRLGPRRDGSYAEPGLFLKKLALTRLHFLFTALTWPRTRHCSNLSCPSYRYTTDTLWFLSSWEYRNMEMSNANLSLAFISSQILYLSFFFPSLLLAPSFSLPLILKLWSPCNWQSTLHRCLLFAVTPILRADNAPAENAHYSSGVLSSGSEIFFFSEFSRHP